MATADERIKSAATTVECAICLDELRTPKALPCLHTFCLACLQEHITATVKAKGNKLVCPECRSKCLPPNPKRPVGEWANQFPTNFHLQKLIEASKQKASSENVGQETSRDSFTQRLKKTRASMDNLLLDLGVEQQNLSATRTRVTSTWNKSKDQMVEVFAQILSAVKTREEEVVQQLDKEYVENIGYLFDKEEYITSRMKQLRHCSENITRLMTGEKENASLELADIEKQLDQTRQVMATEVHTEQNPSAIVFGRSINVPEMVSSTACTKGQPSSALVINPDEVARILSSITELGTFRADSPRDGGTEQASPLPSLPLVPQSRSDSNSPRSTMPNDRPRAYSDEWCEVEYPPPPHETRSPSPQVNPEFVILYSLVSQGDKKEPFVTGVCYVADVLLLTDVNNRCVKTLDIARGHRVGGRSQRLTLRSDPLCVSSVSRTQAVVGSEHCVYLVCRVHNTDKLIIQDTIETSKCYYGIAALSDGHCIAACSDQPPGVDILDLNTGTVTHTISKNPATRVPLFTSPFYVTALPQARLLISDKDNSFPLTCVSTKGDIIYQYARPAPRYASSCQLTWPLGVSGCWNGSALVVDPAQHAVFQLSADCQTASKVLKDRARLTSPSALCFHEDTGSLYVVTNKGQMLVVYKLTNGSGT